MAVGAAAAGLLQPAHGLHGRYFNNATWSRTAQFERIDREITSALLAAPPVSEWDAYSIEWSGSLVILSAGDYTVATLSDDGSEVVIDGRQVVDNLGVHARAFKSARVHLERGIHPVRVRYSQEGGRYAFELLWARSSDGTGSIPTSALLPGVPTMAGYVATEIRPWAVALVVVVGCGLALTRLPARLGRFANARRGQALAQTLDALERPGVALAVIWTMGLAARLLLLVSARPIIWPDSELFFITAQGILEGQYFSHDAYRTLAYPYLLAVFLALTGPPLTGFAILVTQQLIGLASATLFYLVGRRAFRPLVALAGALVYVLHSVTLFYEYSILTETLFTCSLAVALWGLGRTFEAPSWRRGLAAGALCGAAVLVRPVAQWFVMIPLLLTFTLRAPARSRLTAGAGLLLAYAATVVPMMAINQREFGFFGVSLGPGMGLYIRVFEIDRLAPPDTASRQMRDIWAHAQVNGWSANRVRDELDYTRRYSSVEADRMMLEFARETAAAQPSRFAAATLGQWLTQIVDPRLAAQGCTAGDTVYPCSGRMDPEAIPALVMPMPPGAHVPGRWLTAYLTSRPVPMGLVAMLAAAGVVVLARRGLRANAIGVLLVATAAYYTLIPAVSQWPQDRYRLPVDAILFLLAANGARWIGRRIVVASAVERTDPGSGFSTE